MMPPSAFQRSFSGEPVALVPGTLRGYRDFIIGPDMQVLSRNTSIVWPAGPLTAVCLAHVPGWPTGGWIRNFTSPEPPHDAVPDPGCQCGIYACHTPTDSELEPRSVLHPGHRVIGVVEAWGRVQVGERGFRAEFARIVALQYDLPAHPSIRTIRSRATFGGGYVVAFEYGNGMMVEFFGDGPLPSYDPHDWQVQLRRKYPDVTMFRDWTAMVQAYPPIDVSELVPKRKPADVIRRSSGRPIFPPDLAQLVDPMTAAKLLGLPVVDVDE